MKPRHAIGIVVVLTIVGLPLAGTDQPGAGAHPEVEAGSTCVGCHQELTPEVAEEWYASKHGINNVKCFVCHGSTGEDFTREVQADRCVGCHYELTESAPGPCFSCHPSHALSPHLRKPSANQGGDQ
ncbi:MAG: hypothetical protein GY856_32140 [bacterium]|nr:hypothetical protein [bacterium]